MNNDLGLPHTTASYELMLRYCQQHVNASRAKADHSWRTWVLNQRDSLLLEVKLRLAPLYLWLVAPFRTTPPPPLAASLPVPQPPAVTKPS
jgi:hypothetical protein